MITLVYQIECKIEISLMGMIKLCLLSAPVYAFAAFVSFNRKLRRKTFNGHAQNFWNDTDNAMAKNDEKNSP